MFNGLFNFDAKFWRTIVPLLTSPGKVTKHYVEGKRNRYSNPFRFYITVSIIFFLILGLVASKERFDQLSSKSKSVEKETVKPDKKKELTDKEIDSIKLDVSEKLKSSYAFIPESTRNTIIKEIEKEAKKEARDSTKKKKINAKVMGFRVDMFYEFYEDNPDMPIDDALDSLKYEKSFKNRFIYDRTKLAHKVFKSKEDRDKFNNELLSYGSIALFIFLPFFTLFLKLFYIRKKFTYVDHLIFVFHTQTVFFMLLSILFLFSFFTKSSHPEIFILLFLLYLFIAMKKFYQQGYFKTIVKFIMLNFIYLVLGGVGITIVGLISFAIY